MRAITELKSTYYAEHREEILERMAQQRLAGGAKVRDRGQKVRKVRYKGSGGAYERAKQRYHSNRGRALEALGGVCTRCGWSEDSCALQFDHIDPRGKVYNVSTLFSCNWSPRLEEELKKCQLLCANCHAVKTHREGDSTVCLGMERPKKVPPPTHLVTCERCGKGRLTIMLETRFCSERCRKTAEVKRYLKRKHS